MRLLYCFLFCFSNISQMFVHSSCTIFQFFKRFSLSWFLNLKVIEIVPSTPYSNFFLSFSFNTYLTVHTLFFCRATSIFFFHFSVFGRVSLAASSPFFYSLVILSMTWARSFLITSILCNSIYSIWVIADISLPEKSAQVLWSSTFNSFFCTCCLSCPW